MPYIIRPNMIPGMIESAGIPSYYKKLITIPGTNPDGTPFIMPCTQVPLEVGVQDWYYPSYINDTDSLPNIASSKIPFHSKVQHSEIKSDWTLTVGITERVGFYYGADEDLMKKKPDNYPDGWFTYMERLVQMHCLAVAEREAALLFQTAGSYPAGHRFDGTGAEWNSQLAVPGVSDFNPFVDVTSGNHSGLFDAVDAAYAAGVVPCRLILTEQAWRDLRSNTQALNFVKGSVASTAAEIGRLAILRREWVEEVMSEYAENEIRIFVGSGKFTPSPIVKAKGPTAPTTIWGTCGAYYLYAVGDAIGGNPVEGGQYGWWMGLSPLQQEPEEKLELSKFIAYPSNLTYGQQVQHKYIFNGYNLHL